MAPGRRKGSGRTAAAAAAKAQQWKIGDLVLAKMKGFPAWPAVISEPEKWGYAPVSKKLLVYFYGTKQIAFCNYADIEAFTEEKKKSLLLKRQGKGADFVRALDEIIDIYETLKKQNIEEPNLGVEEIKADVEEKECVRSNSLRRTPEFSCHTAGNGKSEIELTLENHDISTTSIEDCTLEKESLISEPIEEVSILDQLRKNPLATITVSRKKRLRDGSQKSSLSRKRTPPYQRPRTLSSADSPKNGESTLVDDSNLSATNLIHDVSLEELVDKCSTRNVTSTFNFYDAVVQDTNKLPTNGSSDDVETELLAKAYESNNTDEEEMVESSQTVEASNDGFLNTEVRLNGKLEVPSMTLVFRKKRKPNRKRLNATEPTRPDREHNSQVEHHASHFQSPIFHGEMAEHFIKADGDEHLPLVKRARVRMGKAGEESQLNVLSGSCDKSETQERISNCNGYCATTSAGNKNSSTEGSLAIKDFNSSPVNNCSLHSARDAMLWKIKKYQISGFELDVEAALPPSKRLHRALEAMSANAAEAKDDCSESPRAPVSDCCLDSQTVSSICFCSEDNVQSPTALNSTRTSGSNEPKTSISEFPSKNLDSHALCSEVKHDSSLTGEPLNTQDVICNGVMEDAAKCSGGSVLCNNSDILEKVVQPFHSELNDEVNATSYKGMNNQLCSTLVKVNDTGILQLECHNSHMKNVVGDETSVMHKGEFSLNADGLSHPFPFDSSCTESATGAVAIVNYTSEATNSDSFHTDGELESRDMQDIATEYRPRLTPNETHNSPDLTPMKELIAAAQARRLLSRSISFSDNYVDTRVNSESLPSPSLVRKEDSCGRGSPSKRTSNHPITTDDRSNNNQNCGRSCILQLKGVNRLSIDVESNAARKAFETFISSLSRTKESIGRATRLAIDCAKYGIAREVIDILLQNLEREPSLHRRIDLFFLVDSITQCSRNLKGGAGDVYPSLVQSVLPRLLSAAAPRGNAACENRRQCLKVLRLWLERRTLPESIISHHIRELDLLDEVSLISSSRRPSRTERAFNDPVREMEGMLVDEYGSNTSFQLSCFNINVLDDEEGSASDEKTFEAVTPEKHTEVSHEKGTIQVHTEKHRHVLEEVDGELEMEDVAPPCEAEVISTSHVAGADELPPVHQIDEQYSSSFVPPLPEDSPPSPPPLPSSPPPLAPPCTDAHAQQKLGPLTVDLHFSGTNNSIQTPQSQSLFGQPVVPNAGMMRPESIPFHAPGYEGLPKPMPPPVSTSSLSGCYGNFSAPQPALPSQNNCAPLACTSMNNKAYTVKPPPPPVSNNFSYVQAEPQQKAQPWGNCSSFPERFQYVHDSTRGNCYGEQGNKVQYHHDMVERGKFSRELRPGPSSHCDKVDMPPAAVCHYGHPSEPPRYPSNGWSPCPRVSNYNLSATRPLGSPSARVTGAPGYWRPR